MYVCVCGEECVQCADSISNALPLQKLSLPRFAPIMFAASRSPVSSNNKPVPLVGNGGGDPKRLVVFAIVLGYFWAMASSCGERNIVFLVDFCKSWFVYKFLN